MDAGETDKERVDGGETEKERVDGGETEKEREEGSYHLLALKPCEVSQSWQGYIHLGLTWVAPPPCQHQVALYPA